VVDILRDFFTGHVHTSFLLSVMRIDYKYKFVQKVLGKLEMGLFAQIA
jgi:hypothetical protein